MEKERGINIIREEYKKQCDIHVVVCSSCNKEIMPDDDKHVFWQEDVIDGTPLKCFECHFETESICRDFGF